MGKQHGQVGILGSYFWIYYGDISIYIWCDADGTDRELSQEAVAVYQAGDNNDMNLGSGGGDGQKRNKSLQAERIVRWFPCGCEQFS